MKLLIIISLCMAVLSQLCAASDDNTKDKRFEIFDLFATKENVYTAAELVEYLNSYPVSWAEFNETTASGNDLELYNSDDYKGFAQAMEEFLETAKKLKADMTNCDLQKEAKEKLGNIFEWKSVEKWIRIDKYQLHSELQINKTGEILSSIVSELYAELPAKIESFKQNLDASDKETYKQFLFACDMFLDAQLKTPKYMFFMEIVDQYLQFKRTIQNEHCKWNVSENFFEGFSMMIEINARNYMPETEAEKALVEQYLLSKMPKDEN